MANAQPNPCRFRFCAAIARIVIATPDLTLGQAAEIAGCKPMGIYYRARRLGITWQPRRNDRPVSAAKIRAAWARIDITVAEAAQIVGLDERCLWSRAKALGLPRRPRGPARTPVHPMFASMWRHGVGRRDIAIHCGVAPSTVTLMVQRLGLPARLRSHKPITLAQWAELELTARMKVTAAAEQRQMIADELVPPCAARWMLCKAGYASSALIQARLLALGALGYLHRRRHM